VSERMQRGEEPPDSAIESRDNSRMATSTREWPYLVFVFGLFIVFIGRALIFP
jgi:hypothetical protein